MTHIIWSNTDVADYGLVIPDYFSEVLECSKGRFGAEEWERNEVIRYLIR
jgi:hypothetical protein